MLTMRMSPKPMEMPIETRKRIPLIPNPKMIEDKYRSNMVQFSFPNVLAALKAGRS